MCHEGTLGMKDKEEDFFFFLLEEKFDDLEKATNEKKEIEDTREKGMDSRDHGRARVKSI